MSNAYAEGPIVLQLQDEKYEAEARVYYMPKETNDYDKISCGVYFEKPIYYMTSDGKRLESVIDKIKDCNYIGFVSNPENNESVTAFVRKAYNNPKALREENVKDFANLFVGKTEINQESFNGLIIKNWLDLNLDESSLQEEEDGIYSYIVKYVSVVPFGKNGMGFDGFARMKFREV